MSNLKNSIANIHRDAENHPFGKRMTAGDITLQEWADWIFACMQLQSSADDFLHPALRRTPQMLLDLGAMPTVEPHYSEAASEALTTLPTADLIGGIGYVLSGANVRGGQVIRKQLEPLEFPVNHLTLTASEMAAANEALNPLRDAFENSEGAQEAFRIMLRIMDEIESRAK
jgi:hypothetical protein